MIPAGSTEEEGATNPAGSSRRSGGMDRHRPPPPPPPGHTGISPYGGHHCVVGCAPATDTSAAISMHTSANRTPIVIQSLLGGIIICTCKSFSRCSSVSARGRQ
jgi:hypothetical protein